MRFLSLILLPLVIIASTPTTWAEEVHSGPMPKSFDLEPLVGPDFVKAALQNAMDGDCTKALEMAQFLKPGGQNPELLVSAINFIPMISLHMQDRALCASFNPEWGTRFFESFIRDIDPKARTSTDLAWRYWHGFGVAQDREKARTLFDIGLLADFSRYDHPHFETLTPVLGYPLPDYARRIAGWIKERLAEKDSRIRFLVDLAKGGGSTLPPDRPPQANPMVSSILLPTTKSAEARYQLGLLVRDGMIPRTEPQYWSGHMMMAANCLHVPAIKEIIQDYKNRNYTLYVLRWLYVLEVMGYDVAQEIQEYDRKARNENPDYEGTVFDEDLVNGKSCIAESD